MKTMANTIKKYTSRITIILAAIFLVANFHSAKAAEKGYVSFTFDDGLASTYDLAYPILKENDCRATAYITTDWVGIRGFMDWNKVQALQNQGRWEIGNHTANHDYLWKKSFSKKYIKRDLSRSQKAFADNGIRKTVSFAPPYGKWSKRLMKVVKSNGFTTSRRAWGLKDYSNDPANFNRYALEAMNLKRDVSFEKVKSEIDYAANKKRWLVILVHNVTNGDPKKDDYSASELRKIAEYVNSLQQQKKIEVLPVGEAFDTLGRK